MTVSRSLLSLGVVAVASVVGFLVVKWLELPERQMSRFCRAYADQDWRTLYDLQPPTYLSSQGITPEKWRQFLDHLASKVPKDVWKAQTCQVHEATFEPQNRGRYFYFAIKTPPDWTKVTGQDTKILTCHKTHEGWLIPTDGVPLLLAAWSANSQQEQAATLSQAMAAAGIEFLPSGNRGVCLSRERLDRFSRGEIDWYGVTVVR